LIKKLLKKLLLVKRNQKRVKNKRKSLNLMRRNKKMEKVKMVMRYKSQL
jgi:hypothetical protein